MIPVKLVKGDYGSFHQNVGRLSLFRKNIFPFSHAEPFGYNNSPNENTITFFSGKIWGNSPISPKIGGRGNEFNHGILRSHHSRHNETKKVNSV